MDNYETLSQAINFYKSKGYVEDFNLKQNCLECRNGEFTLLFDEFHIEEVIRFDINTDPGDQSILYVISSDKYKLKGLLVNSYGIYSDAISDKMLEKLKY